MSDLPPYNPTETESIREIPARFLAEGYVRLGADGTWYIQGGSVTHPKMARFLARHLMRTVEREYWIVNGPQRVLVELDDAPFVITRLDVDEREGRLFGTLNDDSMEQFDPSTIEVGADHVLYTRVKRHQAGDDTGAGHRARFHRRAVQQLAPYLVEDAAGFAVQAGSYRLRLGDSA